MAELGNEIVNRIYEANVVELIAPRANSNSNPAERENWIRAKVNYMLKFIFNIKN